MKLTRKQLTNYLVWRAVEVALVVFLISLIAVVSDQIQSVRRTVAVERLTLEASLRGAVQIGALRAEIVKRQHDIDRIITMVPEQNNVGDVVSVVEKEAQRFNVYVVVPKIEKVVSKDKLGKELPPSGALQDVKLTVRAEGAPADVLHFFRAIENVPYLVGVVGFYMGSESPGGVSSGRLRPEMDSRSEEEEPAPQISLSVDYVFSSLVTGEGG